MKKQINSIILFLIISLLIGCSDNDTGLQTASIDDIQYKLDEKSSGFIVITNETEAPFLDEVQTALLEKQQTANLFNVFYNDGESKNTDGLSKNPFNFEMPFVNTMYYIKDGEVFEEFNLDRYEGLRQQEELSLFLDIDNRGRQNE